MTHEPTTTTTEAISTNGTHRKAIHVQVQAVGEGYPVTLALDLPADKLGKALKMLQRYGIEPPAPQEPAEWRWTPAGEGVEPLPICPKHNAVMFRHDKQKDRWYAHKVIDQAGTERWCRGCRNPSDKADGYLVDA